MSIPLFYSRKGVEPKGNINDISTFTLKNSWTNTYGFNGLRDIILSANGKISTCYPAGNSILHRELASGKNYDISQGWANTGTSTLSNRCGGLWTDLTHFLVAGFDSGSSYYMSVISYTGTSGDLSTATKKTTKQIGTYASSGASINGVCMSKDGKHMYIGVGTSATYSYGASQLRQYDLSTAFDISTAVYKNAFTKPTYAIHISDDGEYIYLLTKDGSIQQNVGGNKIIQYKTSTAYNVGGMTEYKTLQVESDCRGMYVTPQNDAIILQSQTGNLYYYG